MKSLYDFPQIVDVVLERPDEVVETEVRSILRLFAQHGIASGKILHVHLHIHFRGARQGCVYRS